MGIKREQYCGSQIFMDIIGMKKYRMFFMGTSQQTLAALKANLEKNRPTHCRHDILRTAIPHCGAI